MYVRINHKKCNLFKNLKIIKNKPPHSDNDILHVPESIMSHNLFKKFSNINYFEVSISPYIYIKNSINEYNSLISNEFLKLIDHLLKHKYVFVKLNSIRYKNSIIKFYLKNQNIFSLNNNIDDLILNILNDNITCDYEECSIDDLFNSKYLEDNNHKEILIDNYLSPDPIYDRYNKILNIDDTIIYYKNNIMIVGIVKQMKKINNTYELQIVDDHGRNGIHKFNKNNFIIINETFTKDTRNRVFKALLTK